MRVWMWYRSCLSKSLTILGGYLALPSFLLPPILRTSLRVGNLFSLNVEPSSIWPSRRQPKLHQPALSCKVTKKYVVDVSRPLVNWGSLLPQQTLTNTNFQVHNKCFPKYYLPELILGYLCVLGVSEGLAQASFSSWSKDWNWEQPEGV